MADGRCAVAGAQEFVGGGGGGGRASVLGGSARVRRRQWRAGKEILFLSQQRGVCGVAGCGMFRAACGRRPSKQPISRDAELVRVHWAFDVQSKG